MCARVARVQLTPSRPMCAPWRAATAGARRRVASRASRTIASSRPSAGSAMGSTSKPKPNSGQVGEEDLRGRAVEHRRAVGAQRDAVLVERRPARRRAPARPRRDRRSSRPCSGDARRRGSPPLTPSTANSRRSGVTTSSTSTAAGRPRTASSAAASPVDGDAERSRDVVGAARRQQRRGRQGGKVEVRERVDRAVAADQDDAGGPPAPRTAAASSSSSAVSERATRAPAASRSAAVARATTSSGSPAPLARALTTSCTSPPTRPNVARRRGRAG